MSFYRPNVAAILENKDGLILVAERWNNKKAWQFPQGGIDPGESPREAMFREVNEELGIDRRFLEIMEEKSGYRYDFPEDRLKFGVYRGQEQIYFRCRFTGTDEDINLQSHQREFRAFQWIAPADFLEVWLPRFKRDVYDAVLLDFYGTGLAKSFLSQKGKKRTSS